MISCMVVDNDRYLALGIMSMVKKIFADTGCNDEIKFYKRSSYPLDIVFIGVNEANFFEALERLEKVAIDTKVFLIANLRLSSFFLGAPGFHNVTMIYREDALEALESKVIGVIKKMFHVVADTFTERKKLQPEVVQHDEISFLTRNENAVLALFNEGFSGGDIAKILKKSQKTVSGQKRSAMRKLGARTDVELIKMFMFK
ncbi:bacterial regulatory s, luxR family protein [Yersinia ruckeri ATCC 29473]|nr:LuxR family transcriptional regulator [Yersinia ruckeri]KGA49883.1 bacterial regulatory s, luxR family protein [Yersinia ruckeri ATCC 29473]KFE38493.1 LuxR family transcriptional regulator [Yersinia ruckeri]QTD75950.1 LuxR family transcriptional regulator [Yersinia ruckeri]CNB06047.1 putative LuxR-family regulatory protein [Yersinia ruckeri]